MAETLGGVFGLFGRWALDGREMAIFYSKDCAGGRGRGSGGLFGRAECENRVLLFVLESFLECSSCPCMNIVFEYCFCVSWNSRMLRMFLLKFMEKTGL